MKISVRNIFYLLLAAAVAGSVIIAATPNLRNFAVRNIKSFYYSVERPQIPSPGSKDGVVLDVPLYYQEYSLSCEVASLRMALAYKGVDVSEDTLIANLAFDTKAPPQTDASTGKMVWGDPEKGFVGSISGKMPSTGYGVYEKPILALALKYHSARILAPATLEALIVALESSDPVVVWGSVTSGKDISWQDSNGNTIQAVAGEHARTAIGFTGPSVAPTTIILNDPVYGEIQMSTKDFLANWALLGNKAVVID